MLPDPGAYELQVQVEPLSHSHQVRVTRRRFAQPGRLSLSAANLKSRPGWLPPGPARGMSHGASVTVTAVPDRKPPS